MRRSSNADPSEQLQQEEEEEEEEVDCIEQPQMKKHEQSIPEFAVTAAWLEQFHRSFAMHIIKAERPFVDVDCPCLK